MGLGLRSNYQRGGKQYGQSDSVSLYRLILREPGRALRLGLIAGVGLVEVGRGAACCGGC